MPYTQFNKAWREISEMAGIKRIKSEDLDLFAELHDMDKSKLSDLQARDLRRTACVRMSEAGCTEKQIASVTGHAIETTRQILETYIPTTSKHALAAIQKLEDADNAASTEGFDE